MPLVLPEDILYLLCEELAEQEAFDTLFNCACANRTLAVPALTHLYRYAQACPRITERSAHLAPVRGGGEDEAVPLATKHLMVQKWSILWRSIIASSLDATLFPYCRYIKTLDFRDLSYLLEDDQFNGDLRMRFFAEPLAQFHLTMDSHLRRSGRKFVRLNVTSTIDAIGEVVTQHTPMLETISGKLLSHALVRWAPRLPRLQALELYDGSPIEDELVHAAIQKYCPQFNSISIYTWTDGTADERDHKFALFLGTIKPQSLRMLETIRDIGLSAEAFLALNAHSESLKDLRLCVSNDSLPHISLLRGCTALDALRIEDTQRSVNLMKTQNDVFLETIDWLKQCECLRRLSLTRLRAAAALVAPVLLEDRISLRRLEIDSYILKDNQLFHQALASQRSSLEYLSLNGDTEGMFRDDIDIIIDSVKQLKELRVLKLLLIQEVFQNEHLITIFDSLPLLEDIYVTGMEIKDPVLDSVGRLQLLKSAAFAGISKFTMGGILDFISKLGPANRGFRLIIDMADPDTLLSDEELELLRDTLWQKVGGTLEYTPYRDPNISEFEGDSD